MKQYEHFSSEDFACDEDFLKWVKHPDRYPDLDAFWRGFMRAHPDKKQQIEDARQMVRAFVQEGEYFPGDERQRAVWERIQDSADLAEPERARMLPSWYTWAAVVVFALCLGWFLFPEFGRRDAATVAVENPESQFIQQINNAGAPKTVILSDGTSIVLQPHSVLEYPATFDGDVREVLLTGEGFFDVARDVNKPFLVKAGDIVTRVLGTSFNVKNVEGDDNVVVQVKTGKVSVFRSTERGGNAKKDNSVEGVVLMPNQQVVYERDQMKMTKSLVENPTVLIPLKKQDFEFADTPIRDVFSAIEQAYGVDIVFDEEALSACYLNASLMDVPLYDKLKLICKGIDATYEVMDTHIIIYGRGCKEDFTNPIPQ